ncbi:acyl-CoA dehydrogenase family protein [Limnobacter humi]|uniref:Acyl-CoA dehydrogenase family protein n=1 Tax=Limnobacter humi TaxID=1778671 RepID=A0ABT1WFV8_9BURK|nr:acyl-CoA dehydrogenase family protein [Limnobacter humi]MCQ8896398.1 acyl-CoA dehydrogenase family protein [Limnobacter humi]
MYTSYFNETHEEVRRNVRRFVERHVSPGIQDWEEAGTFPRELYTLAGEAGILGVGYPEELGGNAEGDVFMMLVVTEELLRAGSGGFFSSLMSHGIALPPIAKWGSEAMKQRIVPDVLRGEKIISLAVTEPGGGSDVANLTTRAVDCGDHYKVSGSKTYITSGIRADYYTVAVRTGGEGYGGVSMLLMEKGMPGFTTGQPLKKMGWWCSDTAELFFDQVVVPKSNLIGQENCGFLMIMNNFESERLGLACYANMMSELALNAAIDYAKNRQTFGKPLSKHQVIRHKIADMATQLEASREFTYRVAARMQAGKNALKEVSMAKNFATKTSDFITYEAVQIFGGMGYMRESLVERLYRDNRIASIGGGTYEIMNEIIGKQLGL